MSIVWTNIYENCKILLFALKGEGAYNYTQGAWATSYTHATCLNVSATVSTKDNEPSPPPPLREVKTKVIDNRPKKTRVCVS